MNTNKKGIFITEDGQNVALTFALVSTLFFAWALCNGMIDVMDKHFQEELHLSKSQSAWVQFAHYLGYFLMSIPAGWLASKLGYKRGIIVGLLIVAAGGFWFIPATRINDMVRTGGVSPNAAFAGFLAGVCVIASGLTFLETIANPYTTVLGDKRYAAARINLAQSCNGLGWIFGPIIGSMYFYSKDAAVHSLCGGRRRRTGDRGHFLRGQRPRHQDGGPISPGRFRARRLTLHLVPSALRAGCRGAVFLRRRPGGHLQFLHQLYDRGNSPDPRLLGLRRLVRMVRNHASRGGRLERPGCGQNRRRWPWDFSWRAASRAHGC